MHNAKIFGHNIENLNLTPQAQSSECYLPGTIVPLRDIFDKW